MSWRPGEVWLSTELSWFRERATPAALVPFGPPAPALAGPDALAIPSGLEASRRRRAAKRQRRSARKARAAALVIGSSAVLPLAAHRLGASGWLTEDSPSLQGSVKASTARVRDRPPLPRAPERPARRTRRLAGPELPEIQWRRATSYGLPYAGSLSEGTRLPTSGPDWVTWNPNQHAVPNAPWRLFGNERTIRTVLSVVSSYRAQDPDAPRVVVGDISLREGGPMDQHVSHQNGLDVDVYYPRRDGELGAPTSTGQVDRERAQDLLDRFVAAGAEMVFVGYTTGLTGPSAVVVPYPNHQDHMHVRFPNPG